MSSSRFLFSFAAILALSSAVNASASASQEESTVSAYDSTVTEEVFPTSTALAEEVSPDSLVKLSELVQSFVDDGDIVGAELLVIKNGRSILHEGYGLKDQEQGIAMGTGNVFCVRSMTKPLIGTSILLLASDKQLKLDDLVSQYLPNFSGEGQRDITIAHLLTHTSGLSMSMIMAADLTKLKGIQAVADLGATSELEFAPGTSFNYSDQGTDTLTAVIEVVSGMPAADFVRTRVLDPLGMNDSTCVMTEGHPLRERGCCKYSGSRGSWTRFWGPDQAPLFPFFLGSQGLYSTLEDYGLFMEFWLNKGRTREERLLRPKYMRKALTPNPFPAMGSSGMPGLELDYGSLMQLWTAEGKRGADDKREVVVFGHTGSDGTHAWAFPKQRAIVLYFTQSRGTITGLRLEEALGELLLGVPFDANQVAPPFEQYLGYYSEDAHSRYQTIMRDGDDLALETPGTRIRQLAYIGEDRWKFRDKPGVVLEFERSTDGEVIAFQIGEHREFRFQPSAELPSLDEVMARVTETHNLGLLETLGPLRMHSALRIEKLDITGQINALIAWPDKFRVDSTANGNSEHVAFDGERVWASTSITPMAQLEGPRRDAILQEIPFAIFGNWNDWHAKMEVIQRLQDGEREVLVLRAGDTSAPASTFYVDWESGQIMRVDSMPFVQGMGRIGQKTTFSDFRDISGVLLPFKTSAKLANSMIGTLVTTVTSFELDGIVPEGTFTLTDQQ